MTLEIQPVAICREPALTGDLTHSINKEPREKNRPQYWSFYFLSIGKHLS